MNAHNSLDLLASVMSHPSASRHPLDGVGHYSQPPAASSSHHYHPNPTSYANSPDSQTSSHAYTANPSKPGKKARKSSAIAGNDEEGDGNEEGSRKKSKQSLSCGECKVRPPPIPERLSLIFARFCRGGRSRFVFHILSQSEDAVLTRLLLQCDRKIPCSSCIKRGAADSCNWEVCRISFLSTSLL